MDITTRRIVASNLTIAYLSTINEKRPTGVSTELTLVTDLKVVEIYKRFLKLLADIPNI